MNWISVQDSLPDFDVPVLVAGIPAGLNPQMGGKQLEPIITVRKNLKGTALWPFKSEYQDHYQFLRMESVKFWMPIPDLPKTSQS